MAERVKYEQWLDDLEAKKDATPTKVFDRVRQDYVTRLQSVSEQLAQHTATLQEHAANLVAKLRELESNEEAHTEEQAEAGLRKQVGEITSAEWDSSSKKAQRELTKIKENQELIAEELNRIRDILEGDGDESEEDSEPRTSRDFNEMEFLSSVVGPTTGSLKAGKPSTPKTTPTAASPAQAPAPAAPPPAAAEKPPETPAPAAAAPAAPAPAASAPAASAPAAPAPADAKKTDTPTKTPAVESAHVPRTSGVVEQPKTLKCQECGAMNYPSEWYCERCGAEMAVV